MAQGVRLKAKGVKRNTRVGTNEMIPTVKEDNRMGKFQDLKVWQRAKDLAVYIHTVTRKGVFNKDFSLRDQVRKAAVSIPGNIAEGDELSTDKQSIRHFYIAKGSSAEVLTQAIIALEIEYIDNNVFIHIEKECGAISGMLSRLIKARSIN
jgi:four helix bundle protein